MRLFTLERTISTLAETELTNIPVRVPLLKGWNLKLVSSKNFSTTLRL